MQESNEVHSPSTSLPMSLAGSVPKMRRKCDAHVEAVYTAEEWEFLSAIQSYKQTSGRLFPTFTEILHVAHALGYRKQGEQT